MTCKYKASYESSLVCMSESSCECVCACTWVSHVTRTCGWVMSHIPVMPASISWHDTKWRRCIGCLKLQVSFCKRATNYRALLRKITCKDKASYESSLLCMSHDSYTYVSSACMCTTAVCVRVFVRVCVCVCHDMFWHFLRVCVSWLIVTFVCVCHDLTFVCVCHLDICVCVSWLILTFLWGLRAKNMRATWLIHIRVIWLIHITILLRVCSEWVMVLIWASHGTHMGESKHTYMCDMTHSHDNFHGWMWWMGHHAHVSESWLTDEWVEIYT